jgi:hypothetical protein
MVFNFVFFSIRIERNISSMEKRIAEIQREQYLNQFAEAHQFEAAQYPGFVSRI